MTTITAPWQKEETPATGTAALKAALSMLREKIDNGAEGVAIELEAIEQAIEAGHGIGDLSARFSYYLVAPWNAVRAACAKLKRMATGSAPITSTGGDIIELPLLELSTGRAAIASVIDEAIVRIDTLEATAEQARVTNSNEEQTLQALLQSLIPYPEISAIAEAILETHVLGDDSATDSIFEALMRRVHVRLGKRTHLVLPGVHNRNQAFIDAWHTAGGFDPAIRAERIA